MTANVLDIQVVSLKREQLRRRGILDVLDWKQQKSSVLYIGRDMTRYADGTEESKWRNPFTPQAYHNVNDRLRMFEHHIRTSPDLWNSLEELLEYTELGCWCKPYKPCHGDVLLKLLQEKLDGKYVVM